MARAGLEEGEREKEIERERESIVFRQRSGV